jgi:hypothetical protein
MAEASKSETSTGRSPSRATREGLPVAADVSFNDLEKDLNKGNERVLDLLNEHAVKQGYHNPEDPTLDDEQSSQNDPENDDNKVEDHSSTLPPEAVAAQATEELEKQDKEREEKLKKVSEAAQKAREERVKKYREKSSKSSKSS